ncbi:unnamed protein product, partial [Mesorhabditis belari]|uniref:FTH domain-containing protein n=1 Tax=Mesorhabditis belari TaxID=2138241 RepID=A0AAF3JAL6_9BILA
MHLDHVDSREIWKDKREKFEFLPRVQSVANFELKSRFDLAREFLEDFSVKILKKCHLNLSFMDLQEESLKSELKRFLSKQSFTNCRNIAWSGFQANFFESLSQTNVEFIQISCLTIGQFQKTVKNLVRNGIPSKHPIAKIKIFGPHTHLDDKYLAFEEIREIFLGLPEVESEDGLTMDCFEENRDLLDNFINERELRVALDAEMYNEVHKIEAIFRRKLDSEDIFCYFGLIFRYTAMAVNPNFQAEFRMENVKSKKM